MEAKTQPAKSDLDERFERLYYAEVDPEELAARGAKDLAGADYIGEFIELLGKHAPTARASRKPA